MALFKTTPDLAVLKSNVTLSGTFTTSSGTVSIDYGDGNTQTSNSPSNVYAGVNPYLINVTSDKSLITGITFDGQSLTDVDVSDFINLTTVDIKNNLLDNSSINRIIIALDQNGQTGGTLSVGGNSFTVLSGDAVTSVANLQAKGWTTDIQWTPSYLTTVAWYDASDSATVIESGGSVSAWNDKSGNDKHAVQGSGALQPTTNSRTLNSLNVIDFDGTEFMSSTDVAFATEGDQQYVGVVIIDPINQQFAGILSFDGTDNKDWSITPGSATQFDGNLTNFLGASGAYTGGPWSGSTILGLTQNNTGGETKAYMDGVVSRTDSTLNGAYLNTNTLTLAANRDSHGVRLDCAYAELVCLSDLTDATRQKVEGYLAHKWGIEANLDAGHPYKSTAPTL